MTAGVSTKIELVANLAIIVVACLLASVLVKDYLLTTSPQPNDITGNGSSQPSKEASIKVGTKLFIPDFPFPTQGDTLVLAISSTCKFCSNSAPFYKKLTQEKATTRLVAVMPQPIKDGRDYLDRLGIVVDEIRQLPLDSVGVQGTPTLLLLDNSGAVKQSWVGMLTPEREQTVLNALRGM